MKFYKKEGKKDKRLAGKRDTESGRLFLIWTDLYRNLGVPPGMVHKRGVQRMGFEGTFC